MTARRLTIALLVFLALVSSACTSTTASTPSAEPAGLGGAQPVAAFGTEVTVRSPDSQLRIEIGVDELNRARYRVIRDIDGIDTEILGDSTLGLETSVASFATVSEVRPVASAQSITDSFSLPHGKALESTMTAVSHTVEFVTQSPAAGAVFVDVWVANTAVAFRYRLVGDEPTTIDWERTSFAVPPQSRAWLQPNDGPTMFTPAYEQPRGRETTAGAPPPSTFGWTFPALFADDHGWTMITEAGLDNGAAGSHFSPVVASGEYLLDYAARGEGNGVGDPRPTTSGDWTSPWRVIITSTQLGDIVESNYVRHLSPPSSGDFAWVTPGRVSWSWWSDHESSQQAEAIEPFIDLASEMGWEYSLVDANWDRFGRDRLIELVTYASLRNVELMLWYNSGGPTNAVTEAPRDLMHDSQTRREEFAWLRDIGVAGVKVDFFQSDKPITIQQYRDILADAAEFELLVNFHGSTLPRGWQREFPNLTTMEAVRGGEFYTFNDPRYAIDAPRQNTVLAFTRNVVGPMDYTPVVLGDEFPRRTTNGHELALAVVFESSLQHFVDTPENYLGQPPEVIDLLATVPTVWDETRYLAGEPEADVVLARRSGSDWWIGAISALDEPRTHRVDLAALGVNADQAFTRVCDQPSLADRIDEAPDVTNEEPRQAFDIASGTTTDAIALALEPNGGCLLRIDGSRVTS